MTIQEHINYHKNWKNISKRIESCKSLIKCIKCGKEVIRFKKAKFCCTKCKMNFFF
jgi:hypothetical protein